jgi:hypothetical protein
VAGKTSLLMIVHLTPARVDYFDRQDEIRRKEYTSLLLMHKLALNIIDYKQVQLEYSLTENLSLCHTCCIAYCVS